jgi:hypothetical protein
VICSDLGTGGLIEHREDAGGKKPVMREFATRPD